jgi:acyl-CoA thioester hydrolase
MESKYPVKLNIRLDWSEMDLFGHINNVSYFKFIQASRVNYWETIGLTDIHKATNVGPMLASTHCNFKQPLFYPGTIVVEARMDFIKNTSFGIQHRILTPEGEVAAEANDVMVMYDFNKNEKAPFPHELKKIVEKLEDNVF